MTEPVNLNRVRKARRRAEAVRAAEANRARHGRTRLERDRDAREEAERNAQLDRARLEPET